MPPTTNKLQIPTTIHLGLWDINILTKKWTANVPNQTYTLGCLCLLNNGCDNTRSYQPDISKCNKYNIINFASQNSNLIGNIDSIDTDDISNKDVLSDVQTIIYDITYSTKTRNELTTILESINNFLYYNDDSIKNELQNNSTYKTKFNTISTKCNKLVNDYNTQLKNYTQQVTKLTNNIYTQQQTAAALKKKINIALKVLNTNGNRLQAMTKNLATYRAQNAQHDQDRVAIGLPYLNPFFTMSNRNYVIMMLVFIVVLIIVIFVYAFVVGRTSM